MVAVNGHTLVRAAGICSIQAIQLQWGFLLSYRGNFDGVCLGGRRGLVYLGKEDSEGARRLQEPSDSPLFPSFGTLIE